MFNEIYWATRLSALNQIGYGLSIISFICFIVFGWGYGLLNLECSDYSREMKKYWLTSCIFFFFGLILIGFCPTQKDLALIYGWEALTSETAKEVFEKVMERVGI